MNFLRRLFFGQPPNRPESVAAKLDPRNIGHVIAAISKDDLLRLEFALFKAHVEDVCIPQIRAGGRKDGCSPLVISISGYDTDPRELWQIEEVRVWFGCYVRFTPTPLISCPKGPFNSISLFS